MWEKVLLLVAGAIIGAGLELLRERLSRRLDRRGDKIPGAQLKILRVSYEHENRKGSYIAEREAREVTGLPAEQFDEAITELEQLAEIQIDGTWSGNFIIVTDKGKLSLLRGRRRRGA